MISRDDFLPISKEDMQRKKIEQLDFIFVSGDAYVDHPSFGSAVITRLLESRGYKVGIIPQPDWRNADAFKALGRPRLAFLVSSGNMDSMVNHYTAGKKPRREDLYSPAGVRGKRPDRAVTVYCNRIREAFKDVPVIIGGIEASLRRFAHYDFWDDQVRRSILFDSRADLLIYGMGEKPVIQVAEALESGMEIKYITYINGTAYIAPELGNIPDATVIPSFDEVRDSKRKYARAFMLQYREQDYHTGRVLIQPHGERFLVQNPPAAPLTETELDDVYSLPFTRQYHPVYKNQGGIPALKEVKFSLTSQRGCFGGCSFCALNFHQGRVVQSRSHESIIEEAELLLKDPEFKGYIHDVGGPTANFRHAACDKQLNAGVCKNRQCLYPTPCKNLKVDHKDYVALLKKLRSLPGVKKVFVRSGLRYDYIIADKKDEFLRELCENHISGQLKVAPEHVSDKVLRYMGKPSKEVYGRFVKKYFDMNKRLKKEQYLVPYLMSGHPGSDLSAAVELAEYVRDMGYNPEQIQEFYPTPGTLSACMYYTGLDPRTMKPVYVPRDPEEKAMQRALIQYRNPGNYQLVYKALKASGREDLIGFGDKCLIKPPRNPEKRRNPRRENRKRR
ncbi:MAG TPA: YgiQ family radical SAM protein [Bacillota bacterium]|nr:YgiQ family radical SAM protein [Bacillota bacterium]HQO41686.1 YgiQ family radical SAM protein [Bacillota bacterium]HQQ43752.1 YgiQ family radical SAM protein [Bacillota bacterium]